MKIIAFGDIHMATSILPAVEDLRSADLVIVTGDITNFGDRKDAKVVLNDILQFNRNLLCLAGNMDTSDVNDYLEDLGMNLHGQAHMVLRRVCVYGVGGSNPTPFGTPWELSEEQLQGAACEAHHQAAELIELAKPLAGQKIHSILISHAPPYGTAVDKLKNGKHVGSKAIRRCIEHFCPDLCITGHIHEAKGKDTLGKTILLNPGMLISQGYATITIDKEEITYTIQ